MTSATAKSSEPTIDDILASIRRIIADEQQSEALPASAPRVAVPDADDGVLDLAQPLAGPSGIGKPLPAADAQVQPQSVPAEPKALQQEAVISTLRPKAEAQLPPQPVAPQPAAPIVTPTPAAPTAAPSAAKPPVSDGDRLQKLIAGQAEEALSAAFGRISALRVSAETRTLEGLVADLLRPMLKDWLDANLPAIAERLVKQEIERIAAQSGR